MINFFLYYQNTSIEPLYMTCILWMKENGATGAKVCIIQQMSYFCGTDSNDWYTALLVSKWLFFFIFSEYIHRTIINDMHTLDEGKRSERGRGMHVMYNGSMDVF